MIFAKLRRGPLEQPDNIMVEVLSQCDDTPYGRFRVRDLHNDYVHDVFEPQLTLKWWEAPSKPSTQNPS